MAPASPLKPDIGTIRRFSRRNSGFSWWSQAHKSDSVEMYSHVKNQWHPKWVVGCDPGPTKVKPMWPKMGTWLWPEPTKVTTWSVLTAVRLWPWVHKLRCLWNGNLVTQKVQNLYLILPFLSLQSNSVYLKKKKKPN